MNAKKKKKKGNVSNEIMGGRKLSSQLLKKEM